MNEHDDATQLSDPAAKPGEVAEADLRDSTILIVDDNAQNLELLQAYLELLPCRLVTATDGIEALAAVAEHKPDLILLDVMMPRMSGFEVCQKLKSDPATRSIPVVMVTALNEIGDIERGVESGTDDFLTKPVKKLELVTRVKSLLRVRQLKRELDRTLAYLERVEEQEDKQA
jgi:two-component system cell cycle response regulator